MKRFKTIADTALPASLERQKRQQLQWRATRKEGEIIQFQSCDFLILPGVFPPGNDTTQLLNNLGPVKEKTILDYGSGTGAVAVCAIEKGARLAHAIDINPVAIENTRKNAELRNVSDRIKVYVSDGFREVPADIKFDIIAANLPGRNLKANDFVEAAQWDTNFRAHRSLFENAKNHLAPKGKIIIAKANYPEINDLVAIAEANGYKMLLIDEEASIKNDPRRSFILAFYVD